MDVVREINKCQCVCSSVDNEKAEVQTEISPSAYLSVTNNRRALRDPENNYKRVGTQKYNNSKK